MGIPQGARPPSKGVQKSKTGAPKMKAKKLKPGAPTMMPCMPPTSATQRKSKKTL